MSHHLFYLGMDDFLSKPLKLDDLRRMIEKYTRPSSQSIGGPSVSHTRVSTQSDITVDTTTQAAAPESSSHARDTA
jgi:DNA-binding response OmpR family regulator